MAYTGKSSSFRKILLLVLGIGFGLVALALAYQGVKTSGDIRSRAAAEGKEYKTWNFNTNTEGWGGTGHHKVNVGNKGILNYTIGTSKNIPALWQKNVDTSIPEGKKFLALTIAMNKKTGIGPLQPESLPKELMKEDDAEFANITVSQANPGSGTRGACPEIAMLCADGSYVGLVGKDCKPMDCPSRPPRPTSTYPVTMLVYYKLNGQAWNKNPIRFDGELKSSFQRLSIPLSNELQLANAVTIERMRIVFSRGLSTGDVVRVDKIELIGPQITPTPLPTTMVKCTNEGGSCVLPGCAPCTSTVCPEICKQQTGICRNGVCLAAPTPRPDDRGGCYYVTDTCNGKPCERARLVCPTPTTCVNRPVCPTGAQCAVAELPPGSVYCDDTTSRSTPTPKSTPSVFAQ